MVMILKHWFHTNTLEKLVSSTAGWLAITNVEICFSEIFILFLPFLTPLLWCNARILGSSGMLLAPRKEWWSLLKPLGKAVFKLRKIWCSHGPETILKLIEKMFDKNCNLHTFPRWLKAFALVEEDFSYPSWPESNSGFDHASQTFASRKDVYQSPYQTVEQSN